MAFDWGTDVNQATEDAIGRLPEYNSGNFNAGTNPFGLAGGGHITNFPNALTDTATVANGFATFADLMASYANAAAASATSASAAVGNLSATSTSSVALSTGTKSFSTQAGKTFPAGSILLISSDANPTTHWMALQVTTYTGTSLTGDVKAFSGSGSRGDWTIRATGFPGRAAGVQYAWSTNTAASDPTSGKIKVNAAPGSATALYISETDFDGNALGSLIATWDDSLSSPRGRVFIFGITQPANFLILDITSTMTDNGTWDSFGVAVVASGGSLSDGMQVGVEFSSAGSPGSTGPAGPSYAATSATPLAIATGSKTFTTQAGLAYQSGTRARATDTSILTNWVEGVVTSYSGTSLTILVDQISGSGTPANWNISVAGERGTAGSTGASGDDAGFEFQFNTAIAGDPGSGKFLFNNASFMAATLWAISETDNNGLGIGALLAALDNGSGTNKILVSIVKQTGSAYFSFYVTSVLTDQGAYDTFNISPISTAGTIANNDTFHVIAIPLEAGATGAAGPAGPTTAPTWLFDPGTTNVDPGSNEFSLNNATIGSVTTLYLNETGPGASDLSAYIASWDDSTNSTNRGTLYIIQTTDASKYAIFTTGTVTDNGTYDSVALTYVAGPGGFVTGQACAFSFSRSGNAGAGAGDVVGPASATNMALALFDGATGKLLRNSQVDQLSGQLSPITTDTVALGSTTKMWSDLFLASGAVLNFNNGDVTVTHSTGVINVTAGDLRVSSAGSNSSSVVTVGGTQTLTGKTLTSPVINTPTGITKSDVGLANVDNTSDANKPVSTAQAAINAVKKFASVRAATTANITIATALNNGSVIDGVTLATNDLVLVKSQSSAAENGIYVVGASPARHGEFDTYNEHPGANITVQEGTANADTLWNCTSNVGGTLGTTALAFTQLAVTPYTAAATLTLTGQQFALNLNNANIWLAAQTFINSSGIKIQDTNASNTLGLIVGSDLTADRTLTITPGDANRTITLGGNVNIGGTLTTVGNFSTSGAVNIGGTLTTVGNFSTGGALTTAGAFTISGAFSTTLTVTGTTNVTLPNSGTLATTDASSLTSGTLADARLSSTATPYGRNKISLASDYWTGATTNGPEFNKIAGTNNERRYAAFDTSTQETMYCHVSMPAQWNEGTFTFDVDWEHPATTTNFGVVFELAAAALGDNVSADPAFGTAQTVTDTGGTTNQNYITPESSAITAAGTVSAGCLLELRFRRVPANASDTLAVDARVKSVNLYITTDTGHD